MNLLSLFIAIKIDNIDGVDNFTVSYCTYNETNRLVFRLCFVERASVFLGCQVTVNFLVFSSPPTQSSSFYRNNLPILLKIAYKAIMRYRSPLRLPEYWQLFSFVIIQCESCWLIRMFRSCLSCCLVKQGHKLANQLIVILVPLLSDPSEVHATYLF